MYKFYKNLTFNLAIELEFNRNEIIYFKKFTKRKIEIKNKVKIIKKIYI